MRIEELLKQEGLTNRELAARALKEFERLPRAAKRQAHNKGYVDVLVGSFIPKAPRTAAKRHRQAVQSRVPGKINLFRRVWLPGKFYMGSANLVAACDGMETGYRL